MQVYEIDDKAFDKLAEQFKADYDPAKRWVELHPSGIDRFFDCPRRWLLTSIILHRPDGVRTTNSKALAGTLLHEAAAQIWDHGSLDHSVLHELGMDAAKTELEHIRQEEEIEWIDGDSADTVLERVDMGIAAWLLNIFAPLHSDLLGGASRPELVEQNMVMPLKHPVFREINGTLDFWHDGSLQDIKTTGRVIQPRNHVTQQNIYAMLAEAVLKLDVREIRIQGVKLSPFSAEGKFYPVELNPKMAQRRLTALLGAVRYWWDNDIPASLLFRGNYNGHLCSAKWCPLYRSCDMTASPDDYELFDSVED